MICSKIKQLFTMVCCLAIIGGCTDILSTKPNHKRHYFVKNNNKKFYPLVEEYITRVGKRLLIVHENSENLHKINIKFSFNNNDILLFTTKTIYHPLANTVVISKGIIDRLLNEAELAAILAIGIESISMSSNKQEISDMPIEEFNKKIINNLYKAGYDPMTYIELQEEYLNNKENHNTEYDWLKILFSSMAINHDAINAGKKLVLTMPKGLQQGQQRFLSIVDLLK